MSTFEGKIVADLLNEAFTNGKLYLKPNRRKMPEESGDHATMELWVKTSGVSFPIATLPIPDSFPMLLEEVGT